MKISKNFSAKQFIVFVQCNKSTLAFIVFFIILFIGAVYLFSESEMKACDLGLTVIIPMGISFVFFVLMKFLAAEIKFGDDIRRLKDSDNCFEYMIANRSAFFDFNVENVYFKITRKDKSNPNDKPDEDVLFFSADQKYIIKKQKFPDKQNEKGNEEFFRFSISYENLKEYMEGRKSIYSHIISKYKNSDKIALEDFLDNPGSTFEIIVDGYSNFTGERRSYVSKRYVKESIKEGEGWHNWKVKQ